MKLTAVYVTIRQHHIGACVMTNHTTVGGEYDALLLYALMMA